MQIPQSSYCMSINFGEDELEKLALIEENAKIKN
jgi:hypothetical protein